MFVTWFFNEDNACYEWCYQGEDEIFAYAVALKYWFERGCHAYVSKEG